MSNAETARRWEAAQQQAREWSDRGPNPDCQCMADGCKAALNPDRAFCVRCLKLVPPDLREKLSAAAFNQPRPTPVFLELVTEARKKIAEVAKGGRK